MLQCMPHKKCSPSESQHTVDSNRVWLKHVAKISVILYFKMLKFIMSKNEYKKTFVFKTISLPM